MKAEDIDKGLEQRGGEQQASARPAAESLFAAVLRDAVSRPAAAEELRSAQEQARADRLVAHQKLVLAKRAALAPRIEKRILAKLQARHSPCALLLGPTGCGKTSAALWLRVSLPGEWAHARDLGACERHHKLGEGTAPAFDRACSSRVLYLDDLGTEDVRDIGVLQHVLERRYASGLATCVTSGLTRPDLTNRYGAATMRRLAEQHVLRADGTEWGLLFVDLTGGTP